MKPGAGNWRLAGNGVVEAGQFSAARDFCNLVPVSSCRALFLQLVTVAGIILTAVVAQAQAPMVDDFNPGANNSVNALAVQADGKILVSGCFTNLAGQIHNRIGRLNPDGSLDADFNADVGLVIPDVGIPPFVDFLVIQPDGKILVAGYFGSLNGEPRDYIGRLNSNGTVDTDFHPYTDGLIYAMAVQADGKILVGGSFKWIGGQQRLNLARLNPDGTLDTDFNPGSGLVLSLAVQADGKILVGGQFTALNGRKRFNLGRLNPDGTTDPDFNPGADGDVISLAVQADGKILAGGWFSALAGQTRLHLARLNPDGTLDAGFNPGADDNVNRLALQADGKILVGGHFQMLGGLPRQYGCGRLNPDGTVDIDFSPGTDSYVNSMTVQPDGKVLAGGSFGTLSGQSRNHLGRFNATDPAIQNLSFSNSTITWLRSGAAPEVWRTSFEVSTNGADWTNLGAGERTPSGWQLTGVSVPAGARIRARGFVATEAAKWFVETIMEASGPAQIVNQPVGWTNNAGTTAILSVQAGGAPPLNYYWLKNGMTLLDGGNVSGAAASILTLHNVLHADTAGYSVVVSNISGCVTSSVANLFVLDPAILVQPTNQSVKAGQTVLLSVTAPGTAPLNCRWFKNSSELADGGNVSGSASPALTLSNVVRADAGGYSFVVSNAFGVVTSAVATLTVADPAILVQPVSQWIVPGQTACLGVIAGGTPLLSYQWRKNGTNFIGATGSSLTFSNAQVADSGSYDVIVTNGLGGVTSVKATLAVSLTTDSFNPRTSGGGSPDVYALAVQPNGRIIAAGNFEGLCGQTCHYLGQLNADGTLDTQFHVPSLTSYVLALAAQADGKTLVGGHFRQLGGTTSARRYVGRINPSGIEDLHFNLSPVADSDVESFAIQADGRIIVGGSFASQPGSHLARLNPDGTLDTNFTATADNDVFTLAMQSDGGILTGGSFTNLAGQPHSHLGRLNADGTLDTNFTAVASGWVFSVALQADGKILVGGSFTSLAGHACTNLGRLIPDGAWDGQFNPNPNGVVYCLAAQADGGILAGGDFTRMAAQPRSSIARLAADGTLDTNFNVSANGYVNCVAVQPDGRILVGGNYTTLGGQARANIGRLLNPTPATQNLAFDGSTVTWLRGGSSPEVWRTTFESSTNGANWNALGAGTRIAGGWQLTGVSVPAGAVIRARGFVAGGGISEWFAETNLTVQATPPPVPLIHTADGGLGFAGGCFGFNVSGPAGLVIIIEASTNLINWVPIQTNALITGQIYFTDPQSGAFPKRFYRARFGSAASPQLFLECDSGSRGYVSNHFGFNMSGMPGQTVVFETSTNLLNWTPILTNTLLTGYCCFSDTQPATEPCRFFRVREGP